MERCTSQMLEAFLADYGWVFRSAGENEWLTGFEAEECSFPLRISLTETWISFQIQPFLGIKIDWECWPEISRWLLDLNHTSPLVKLSINAEGFIELNLDVLNMGFQYDGFCTILGLIGFYADMFYDDILSHLDLIGFRYSESLGLLI